MRTDQSMSGNTTKDLRLIPVFELSDEELTERLSPTYEEMKQKKLAKGGYLTYYDQSVCPTSAHMVHEYSNRKELIWMDGNYQEHFVKIL